MRRFFWRAALAVLLVTVAYLVALAVRIQQQAGVDEARPADLIMVLGAAEYRGRPSPVLKARLDHALVLYRRRMAPKILTTGGAGGDPDFTEGGVARAYLIEREVPAEAIVAETESSSTAHSIAAAGEIMERMGLHSCIVVSDGYHVLRAKKMLEARGLTAYGSPRRSSAEHGWWVYMRESVGYFLWAIGLR